MSLIKLINVFITSHLNILLTACYFKATEFWKVCIFRYEFDGFPKLKHYSDEISGNINNCDLKY